MIRGKKNRDLGRVDRAFLGSIGNPGEARPINARLETESRTSSLCIFPASSDWKACPKAKAHRLISRILRHHAPATSAARPQRRSHCLFARRVERFTSSRPKGSRTFRPEHLAPFRDPARWRARRLSPPSPPRPSRASREARPPVAPPASSAAASRCPGAPRSRAPTLSPCARSRAPRMRYVIARTALSARLPAHGTADVANRDPRVRRCVLSGWIEKPSAAERGPDRRLGGVSFPDRGGAERVSGTRLAARRAASAAEPARTRPNARARASVLPLFLGSRDERGRDSTIFSRFTLHSRDAFVR